MCVVACAMIRGKGGCILGLLDALGRGTSCVLTLSLVAFDHAGTLGQDGFLERRHQSVDATLHQLEEQSRATTHTSPQTQT